MADTLADVLKDQQERARRREEAPVRWGQRHRSLLLTLLVPLVALSAYLWLFPPGSLTAPAAQPPPPELMEAGLRMEVYLTALKIQEFQSQAGRLPNSLEEAGKPYSAVEYERVAPRQFVLWLQGPEDPVVYRSGESLEAFLGDAPQVIRGER